MSISNGKENTTGLVYSDLFNHIIAGKYPPRTRLKETKLAEQYDVSRTPVRDALRLLEQDGLIEILPKKGARIIGMTVDDIEEIYDIRNILEIQAIRYSSPILNIQGLLDIRERIESQLQTSDVEEFRMINRLVHEYFINASGRRRLISMLRQIYRLIEHFWAIGGKLPENREWANRDHLDLIDSLCMRDVEKASEILKAHIERSKKNAIYFLAKYGLSNIQTNP